MSTPAPLDPQASPKDQPSSAADAVAAAMPFEEKLRQFWEKNSRSIFIVVGVVLLSIVGRGIWEYVQRERENGIRAEYAAAGTADKLKSFASTHSGHPLAGVAALRVADEAYAAANYVDAQTNYQRAAEVLKDGPLAGRARLGLAVSKVAAGQAAEGEEKLKQVANDVSALKAVRSEAAYHLAVLAKDAGRPDEAVKYLDLAGTVDAQGIWAQRAMMMRATLPVPAPAAPAEPAVKLPSTP